MTLGSILQPCVAVACAALYLLLTFGPDDFPPMGPVGQIVSDGAQYELPLGEVAR